MKWFLEFAKFDALTFKIDCYNIELNNYKQLRKM